MIPEGAGDRAGGEAATGAVPGQPSHGPAPGPGSADPVITVTRWGGELRILQVTHNMASEEFGAWSRGMGLTSAVLATVVGTAIFTTLSTSTNTVMRVTAATLSLVAAALSTIQMISNYPRLAQHHRDVAVHYAALRRRVTQILAEGDVTPRDLEEVSIAWNEIEAAAPSLSSRIRRRARRELATADSRRTHTTPPQPRRFRQLRQLRQSHRPRHAAGRERQPPHQR